MTWGKEIPNNIAFALMTPSMKFHVSNYVGLIHGETQYLKYDYNTNVLSILLESELTDRQGGIAAMIKYVVAGVIIIGLLLFIQYFF